MKDYLSHQVRNIAVIGSNASGKTSLVTKIMEYTNCLEVTGKDRRTALDFDSDEVRKESSIYTSLVPIEWKESKINFLDTPGYIDYIAEVQSALSVVEGSILVVDSKVDISSSTKKLYKMLLNDKIPTILFINKLHDENTSFEKSYEELRNEFGKTIIPFEYPIYENNELVASINILRKKVWYFKGEKASNTTSYDVEEKYLDLVEDYRNQIYEAIAMNDEELMEAFLNGEEFDDTQLTKGLRLGVLNGDITPVFSGSANLNFGIERLLDLIVKYLPTYAQLGHVHLYKDGVEEKVQIGENQSVVVKVFKTVIDSFVGKISYVKVLNGTLKNDCILYNPQKDSEEKIGQLYSIRGKQQVAIGKLFTGDIGAVMRLTQTQTNNNLTDTKAVYTSDDIRFEEGMLMKSVWPKSKNDEDKLNGALQKICEEDLSVKTFNNLETKELVLYTVGDQQLDVVISKLAKKYKVEVELRDVKVPYRETIRKKVVGEGKHKKQSGGHGQFGHVFVEFSHNDSQEEMVFEETVFGGAVPRQYFGAVEEGLRECMNHGPLGGYHMVNVKCVLQDGKYHDVDSSEMSFKLAAHLAFKDAMTKAQPILLEPMVKIEVICDEEYLGSVIGDVNKRRGSVIDVSIVEDSQVVQARLPYASILDYATSLRAMTSGNATFTMENDGYEVLPEFLVNQVLNK